MRIELDDGKYVVIAGDHGELKALRHGLPWRDLYGDNLIYNMVYEIERLKTAIEEQENKAKLSEILLSKVLDFQVANRGTIDAFYRCYTFKTGQMPDWVIQAEELLKEVA